MAFGVLAVTGLALTIAYRPSTELVTYTGASPQVIESEVVPASEKVGISQVVFSPIAQGVLTGKYQPGQSYPAGSRATDEKGGATTISRFLSEEVLTAVQQLRPLAESLDLTMSQMAVAWVLQNDNVASAIIGASRPEQVEQNVAASGREIPAEVMTRIDEILGDKIERDPTRINVPAGRPG